MDITGMTTPRKVTLLPASRRCAGHWAPGHPGRPVRGRGLRFSGRCTPRCPGSTTGCPGTPRLIGHHQVVVQADPAQPARHDRGPPRGDAFCRRRGNLVGHDCLTCQLPPRSQVTAPKMSSGQPGLPAGSATAGWMVTPRVPARRPDGRAGRPGEHEPPIARASPGSATHQPLTRGVLLLECCMKQGSSGSSPIPESKPEKPTHLGVIGA